MVFRPLPDGTYLISNDKYRDHILVSIDYRVRAMESGNSCWRLKFHPPDSAYEITHLNSGKVLDLDAAGGSKPGTQVIIHPAHGGLNQRWRMEQLDQGPIVLYSMAQPHLFMTAATDNNQYIIDVTGDENSTRSRARWYFKKP